ncbi:unnamed protein product [Pelagomonas calceolata]|uniref:MYND-type domain-containing protein n=1 Tax=Pelagomonas calceolata TaxID=35677 RepID=A0A8J2ST45_9STRA|nr:unnamed protein product [Pelagomonas calceolata]
MILTTCAACAAPLAHNAPRCVRCKLRYCNATCQHDHWRRGHKQMCKKIHRGGNAEQYNADKKYKEAVAEAVEACADDTKGQTCYICTQALHWKTKEGLVRMCACRGTAGFAHVSCLAEQAKILMDEAEANNLDWDARNARFWRWHACGLCEQQYHGLVYCALGWGCWKTYLGRPETDQIRSMAMNQLGNGLLEADHHEDACSVQEAQLSTLRHFTDTEMSENNILAMQNNLAATYGNLGRYEDALRMQRDVHSGRLKLLGAEHNRTMSAATNYAMTLKRLGHFEEARSVLRKTIPVARRVLGESHIFTLQMKSVYAEALCADHSATLDDLREGVTTLEETEPTARRVLGGAHPLVGTIESDLRNAKALLRARAGSA